MKRLADPTPAERPSLRDQIRSRPGWPTRGAAACSPSACCAWPPGSRSRCCRGPLTLPAVLLGLWIWSTEFAWARRRFVVVKTKAGAAWAHAPQHPLTSTVVTGGGLSAAAVAIVAVRHLAVVGRLRDVTGI